MSGWLVVHQYLTSCCFLLGPGIALSNGYLWKMQRKFANTHLRQFGGGKKTLEKNIEQESTFLCEAFQEEQANGENSRSSSVSGCLYDV